MRKNHLPRIGFGILCGVGASLLLASCTDSSYDLNKDFDLTMGLGSDGLAVKLGQTEQIMLADLLETDESVKLDQAGLYYLVQDGEADINVKVERADASIQNAQVNTSERVLSFQDVCEQHLQHTGQDFSQQPYVPVTPDLAYSGKAEGNTHFEFTFDDVSEDIKRITHVSLEDTPISITISVDQTPAVKFGIESIRNLRITLPSYLHARNASAGTLEGQVLTVPLINNPQNGKLCEVTCYAADFGSEGLTNEVGTISLPEEISLLTMEADVYFRATGSFNMSPSDYADVSMSLCIGNNPDAAAKTPIAIQDVTGEFDPDIDPDFTPMDVKSSLPDFLENSETALPSTNPTLKLMTDFSQIPVDVEFSAMLTATREGQQAFTKSVVIPESPQRATIRKQQSETIYFYQSAAPYDPEEDVPSSAQTYRVNSDNNRLSSLFEQIPDEVTVDMGQGRTRIPQGKTYTVTPGHSYQARADYRIFVPFEFTNGLYIEYNDSTDQMNDDLKDYQAEGIQIRSTVINKIPLRLLAHITATDLSGNTIEGIRFTPATIEAGGDDGQPTSTDITLEALLDDPADLSRVDRLRFRIEAASGENVAEHQLYSTQYLQFTQIKLRLIGKVTANFN